MGRRGWAKPGAPTKCSELWGSLLPKLERAKAWQHDTVNGSDNDDDDEGEDDNYDDSSDVYWAITVWKARVKHFPYALCQSAQTLLQ